MPDSAPIPHRPHRLLVVLAAFVAAGVALGLSGPHAGAATRFVAHATAHRAAHAHVSVVVTRSATATQRATVEGRTASATGHATATRRASASARVTSRASAVGVAASRHAARVQAHRLAARRAKARARAAAHHLAVQRAHARAAAAATRQARSRAQVKAAQTATSRASALAAGSTDLGSDTGDGTASGGSTDTGTGSTSTTGSAGAPDPVAPITAPPLSGPPLASTPVSGNPTTQPTASGPSCGGESVVKDDGTPWTCTFDDEFDGSSLNTNKWLVQLTANSGFDQAGACYTNDPDTISVTGGTLNLTVNKLNTPISCPSPKGAFTTNYTAGEVTTLGTFSQTYGRYEVRAQLPATTAAGLQETFWLWPNTQNIYGPWPASGEIDFAEFYSQYAGWVIPYLHYNYNTSTTSWATNTNIVTAWPAPYNQPGMNCTINQAGYNTYTLTWQPNLLVIQVNGQNCLIDHYQSTLSGTAPFDQPFFLALTQALGTGSNAPTTATPLPATTHVDYVRVWK